MIEKLFLIMVGVYFYFKTGDIVNITPVDNDANYYLSHQYPTFDPEVDNPSDSSLYEGYWGGDRN